MTLDILELVNYQKCFTFSPTPTQHLFCSLGAQIAPDAKGYLQLQVSEIHIQGYVFLKENEMWMVISYPKNKIYLEINTF